MPVRGKILEIHVLVERKRRNVCLVREVHRVPEQFDSWNRKYTRGGEQIG